MSSGLSQYAEKKIMDLLFGGTAYSVPGSYFAALLVGDTEVSTVDTNYSRVEITNDNSNFPDDTEGDPYTKVLSIELDFPTPSDAWGTPDNVRLYDSLSGGNEIAKADITSPTAIGANQIVFFAADALSFSMGQS